MNEQSCAQYSGPASLCNAETPANANGSLIFAPSLLLTGRRGHSDCGSPAGGALAASRVMRSGRTDLAETLIEARRQFLVLDGFEQAIIGLHQHADRDADRLGVLVRG